MLQMQSILLLDLLQLPHLISQPLYVIRDVLTQIVILQRVGAF